MIDGRAGSERGAGRTHGVTTILATDSLDRTRARDDAAIVARVLDGDREAFRTLVDRESRVVVRACYRVLGDLHDAEDAAQEAFVTAFRSLGTWRAEGPIGAWIVRIAVRIAIRMAASRRTVAWIDPAGPEPAAERLTAAGHGSGPAAEDPARQSVRRDRDLRVRAAVESLAEPYREVVALRFFGELTLAEIASQTGRPLGTVKTHLHRGLGRLRESLGGEVLA
jgi:RNA polymerase sigma-70 factor (ECF subfamily)